MTKKTIKKMTFEYIETCEMIFPDDWQDIEELEGISIQELPGDRLAFAHPDKRPFIFNVRTQQFHEIAYEDLADKTLH